MLSNTSGEGSVAMGWRALNLNTIGNGNVAIGAQALASNVAAGLNVAIGYQSMLNTNGAAAISNTAVGPYTLSGNLTGSEKALFSHDVGVSARDGNSPGGCSGRRCIPEVAFDGS
jgi:trimeric autotransporter adhesin